MDERKTLNVGAHTAPSRTGGARRRRLLGAVATGLLAALAFGAPANAKLTAVGPVVPDHGFPEYYQDQSGLRLELCVQNDDPFCSNTAPNPGPATVAASLAAAADALSADLLVFVDVGGDALARGDEPGLASPLCDAVMLAAAGHLRDAGRPVLGAVFGPGCDGELTLAELDARLAELGAAGALAGAWGLTPGVAERVERALAAVPTEASAQPLRAFRGERGDAAIRSGRRSVALSAAAALTVHFDVGAALAAALPLAAAVRDARDLEHANELLHELGVRSELDLEREAAERGAS
jgi:hypothetical protein